MRPFEYHRPASLAEAAALLADADAALIAGGHTLLPAIKARLRAPSALIDLARVPGLDSIARGGERIMVGAMVRHARLAADPLIAALLPSLAAAARVVGDPAVRARGTMGGAVANNDPAADYPAAVLALDGEIVTNTRTIPADAFFTGMFETALAPAEIVAAIGFRPAAAAAYAKFRHPISRYAMAGVHVARYAGGVRVAVTGAAAAVFRWSAAEAALTADFSVAAIEAITLDPATLTGDMHASPDYRAQLCQVMLARAVAEASQQGSPA